MLSIFQIYLQLGIEHILDVEAYDHLLFIAILTLGQGIRTWRQMLILATAFTIGHSITLALSVLEVFKVAIDLVEMLIPITIIITNLSFFYRSIFKKTKAVNANYMLVFAFGLIHGLGFSNYLNAIMFEGAQIAMPLFAFNLGVEIAQLIIITLFMMLNSMIQVYFAKHFKTYNYFLATLLLLVTITLFY